VKTLASVSNALGVGVLAMALTACWPTPGAGPDRRSFNPFERTLAAATVGRMTEAFRRPLTDGAGAPVATPAGLFVRTGRRIAAFEPRTGAPRWSVRVPSEDVPDEHVWIGDAFVLDGDRVMVEQTSYYAGGVLGYSFVTLSTATGARQGEQAGVGALASVRGDRAAGSGARCGGRQCIPAVHVQDLGGGTAWGGLVQDQDGGTVTLGEQRLYMNAGEVIAYDTAVPCRPYSEESPILLCDTAWVRPVNGTATPVVIGDDTTVYSGSGDGSVYALDAATGAIRWTAPVGSPVERAPALAHDTLYVPTADGRLSAVPAGGCGAAVCAASWTTTPAGVISVQPAVAGDVVYVGSADGTLRAFDANGCDAPTCAPLWTANAGAPITGGMAVYGGKLYVGTADALVAYGLPPD
jgi:outer membrane protein assembly factor BamB